MRTRDLTRALGCAALLALPAALHAQYTAPNIITTPGDVVSVLGKNLFINHGLVGVGRIPASSIDGFGESFGSVSGLQVTDWTKIGDNSYAGTFNILPDRGYNSGAFYSDYAARIQRVSFTFTAHTGGPIGGSDLASKIAAQNQIHHLRSERHEVSVPRCDPQHAVSHDRTRSGHRIYRALRRHSAIRDRLHRSERPGREFDESPESQHTAT